MSTAAPLTAHTHVVDGITGFVGANLAYDLLRHGCRVVGLSRRDATETTARVARAVIGEKYGGQFDAGLLHVHPYDLSDPGLGLSHDEPWLDRPLTYWHVAACLKYQPGSAAELVATNIEGTRNTVGWLASQAPPGSRYFLVSTAYSAGLAPSPVAEQWHPPAPPSAFRNYYEWSKRESEHLFREYWQDGRAHGLVLRLGVIVGDSVSYETTSRFGIYDFLARVARLASRWPGEQLRIVGDPDATLALLPIDTCTRALVSIANGEAATPGDPVVHVVDPSPVRVQEAFDYVGRILPVTLRLVTPDEVRQRPLSPVEKLLEAGMIFSGRYLDHTTAFEHTNLDQLAPGVAPGTEMTTVEALVKNFMDRS